MTRVWRYPSLGIRGPPPHDSQCQTTGISRIWPSLQGSICFISYFTRDCGPCRVLAAASHHSSFHFGSRLIWEAVHNDKCSASIRKRRSAADLKGCIPLFKSWSVSYLHTVTDVCVCVCYLLVSVVVIIQWPSEPEEHKSLGHWCDLNS